MIYIYIYHYMMSIFNIHICIYDHLYSFLRIRLRPWVLTGGGEGRGGVKSSGWIRAEFEARRKGLHRYRG